MRYLLTVLMLLLVVGCKGKTEFGECVGFGSDERQPDLVYKLSFRNTVWSTIFSQTIIVPVLWATDYAFCPVAMKNSKPEL